MNKCNTFPWIMSKDHASGLVPADIMNSYENEQTSETPQKYGKRRTEERKDEKQTKEGKGELRTKEWKKTNEHERRKNVHFIE